MKKYLFIATALVALASCSESEFVGENTSQTTSQKEQGAIAFGTGLKAVTRANSTGSAAASLLNNKFIVSGFKGTEGGSSACVSTVTGESPVEGIPAIDAVYNDYQVKWSNTANSTTSNTSGWEYVGLDFLAPSTLVNSNDVKQSIKYWDYSAGQYDFIAYSTGDASVITSGNPTSGQVLVTKINANTAGRSTGAYSLRGAAADLEKCYIANMVTAYNADDYQEEVEFEFRPLSAKVRMALYETVPGYSINNVAFYSNATTKDDAEGKPSHLFTTGSEKYNEKGKYVVYFPTIGSDNKTNTDYNKAHVIFTPDDGEGTQTQDKTFGSLDFTNTGASKEGLEADSKYLGRSSNQATYAGSEASHYYTVVLPNESGAALNLQVDYDLISTDGSGEVIHVTKASAKVPKEFASWKSGYAYTYLFKISRNTNGWTGPDTKPSGLYPITFDAVVVDDEADNTQETITTVATPSITTYAKGTVVTANDEYKPGSTIYIIVNKDGNNVALSTTGTVNAKLYKVTLEGGATQTINEASVANVLINGTESPTGTWTVTDANDKSMVVTAESGLTVDTKVDAADAPDGNQINGVNVAKFTATTTYTVVPEGTNLTEGKRYYKIEDTVYKEYIGKSTDTSVAANTYYTADSKIYVFEFIDTADSDKKYYKIIKVE